MTERDKEDDDDQRSKRTKLQHKEVRYKSSD